MSNLPSCPKCNSEYTYEDGVLLICPECGYEWSLEGESEESEKVIKDANGNVLSDGDTVTVIKDFNEEKGLAVAEEIKANGGEAAFVKVDISKSEEVQNMVKFTVDTFGKLDVAVNNAALTPDDKPAAEFDEDYWNRLISVDLTGTALYMKYELQQMQKQGHGGSIINISSVSGFRSQPNTIAYVYVAAKHLVAGMTKVAAMEKWSA